MTKEKLKNRFLLLYASQTGQAKAIAEEISERATQHGLEARLFCISMTEKKFWLEREPLAVLLSSTTGDGEPPDTASKFYRRMHKKTLANNLLEHLNFTVLALGDSNYSNFCNCGKNIDKRLVELGAKRFYASGFADDATGLEIVVDPWIDGLFPALKKFLGSETTLSVNDTCNLASNSEPNHDSVSNIMTHESSLFVENVDGSVTVRTMIKDDNIVSGNNLSARIVKAESDNKGDPTSQVSTITADSGSNKTNTNNQSERSIDTKIHSIENTEEMKKEIISNSVSEQGDNAKTYINNSQSSKIIPVSTISEKGDHNLTADSISSVSSAQKENKTQENSCLIKDVTGNSLISQVIKNDADKHVTGIIRKTTEVDVAGLTKSESPLCDRSLSLPLCPAPYIRLEVKQDKNVDFDCIPPQNGCPFPSSASTVTEVPVISVTRMTREDAVKTTLKVELDISKCGWTYEPGDSIGVVCPNNKDDVDILMHRLNLHEQAENTCLLSIIEDTKKKNAKIPAHYPQVSTLKYLLTFCCDIRSVPKKAFLRALVEYTSDSHEKRRLQELCSKQGSENYTEYIRTPEITLIDILLAFSTCNPKIEVILEQCPRLQPRPYSASSSPLVTPGRYEFVFNIVHIPKCQGRAYERRGICTGWLSDISKSLLGHKSKSSVLSDDMAIKLEALSVQDSYNHQIPIFIRSNQHFRAPEDLTVPYIMVGPGTGVAPFVGFLRQRHALLSESETAVDKPGEVWLFYGCRHHDQDYLYRQELEGFAANGMLRKCVVSFSRDEHVNSAVVASNLTTPTTMDNAVSTVRYVQDNIRLYKQEITSLVCDKQAHVFVCGDAKGMARGVTKAFVDILQQCRGMSQKEASDFIMKMRIYKRYLEDVWT